MNPTSAPRVLVVDNDPRIGDLLNINLSRQGYQVCVVKENGVDLLDHAIAQAHAFRPHVAVVDLRLLDDFVDERSGLDLLPDLQSARCILFSAYLDSDVTMKAAHEYNAFAWVDKYRSEDLYRSVNQAAAQACAESKGISVQWPASWPREELVSKLFAGSDVIPDSSILDDVIAQLFADKRQFYPETISGAVNGLASVIRGRSAVLKIFSDEQLEPKVLKLGNAARIKQEDERYQRYVKGQTPGLHATQLEQSVGFWDLGGAVYSFIGSSEETLPTFAMHYASESHIKTIVQPLRHFFKVVWRNHYDQPKTLEHATLFDAYDEAFGIGERLSKIDDTLFAELQTLLPHTWQDPVVWVERFGHDSVVRTARQTVTHGDLHGDNLFVEGDRAWIIDFERTGPGHALRDFAELEVDIYTRLLAEETVDWQALLELALVLAQPATPTNAFTPDAIDRSQPRDEESVCRYQRSTSAGPRGGPSQ